MQPLTEIKMPAAKLFCDERVLEVMNFVIEKKIRGITDEANFLKSIGYNSWRNLALIRKGLQHFKIEHLQNVCTIYSVSADFLLNKNCFKMFVNLSDQAPLDRIVMAAKELEIYIRDLENKVSFVGNNIYK